MLKKTLQYLGYVVLVYVLLCLVTPYHTTFRKRSIVNQISYLSQILDKGYDDQLQHRFPEGKLFSNALLALATIEYCERNKTANKKYALVVDNCIDRIQSAGTYQIFNPNMEPKYGMFYNAWSIYVYSSYKKSELYDFSMLQNEVEEGWKVIQKRLTDTQLNGPRVLDSYDGVNWPADNLIGLISLDDRQTRRKWLSEILNSTGHQSGLIHHAGGDKEEIRGSSSAMMTFCLNEMGYDDIERYKSHFERIFIDEYLGVQLVKENEDGSNKMDVDSGPVVFGYGASATIMNIKTQASLNSPKSKSTWSVMNLISLPINIFGKKYYLMKQEPMFDLFMLWGCVGLN